LTPKSMYTSMHVYVWIASKAGINQKKATISFDFSLKKISAQSLRD